MKVFIGKFFLCLLSISILLLPVISCGKAEKAEVKPLVEDTVLVLEDDVLLNTEILPPVEQPKLNEGMITFFSGDVSIFDNGTWYEVEIGDLVAEKNVIKVETDSYCEIQFGEIAVVKIQENSEINLASINLTPGSTNVNLDMSAGTVLSKVQRLTNQEAFRVKTQTAVCGVRGTEFSVTAKEGEDTVLAVRQGSVSVLPASIDIDNLRSRVADKGEDIVEIIERIEREAPVVTANQEVAIDRNTVERTRTTAETVERVVEEIEAEQTVEARQDSVTRLSTAVEERNRDVVQTVEPPRQLSQENAAALETIDDMRIISMTPVRPAEDALEGEPAAPAVVLHRVAIRTVLADAQIEYNGRPVGRANYSGIFTDGDNVSFRITRDGYEPYSLGFTVTAATARLYRVELEKIPEPEIPVIPEKQINIRTVPADAQIFLGTQLLGAGTYRNSYQHGTDLEFTVSKPGFITETLNLSISETSSDSYEVVLAPAMKTITITALPPDSMITARGETAAGRMIKEYQIGEIVPVTVSKPGFNDRTVEIVVSDISPDSYEISLMAAMRTITITAVPSNTRITVRQNSASGRMVRDFQIGDRFDIVASLDGYAEQRLPVTVTAGSPASYNIRLVKKPVDNVLTAFTARIIDRIAYQNGRLFAADSSGNLYSSMLNGTRSWSLKTENSPNANSSPVPAGDLVFFSGAREFVAVESETGRVYSKTNLDTNSAHMFGRKIIPFDNRYIYPRNNSLLISSFRQGAAEDVISLPSESGMSPVIWNRQIVIADQEGTVNFIDPSTKAVTSRVPTSSLQPIALSMAISGDTGIFANRRGNISAVDLRGKRVVWESQIPDERINVFTTPSHGSGNVFFFTGNKIHAYRITDGTVPFAPVNATSPPLIVDGKLYYGIEGGALVEADAASGSVLRNIPVNIGNITTQPVLADTKIIAGSAAGKIAVLNPAGF